jgi:hypothetical protein
MSVRAAAEAAQAEPRAILERRYRRLLACYPGFFRHDSEDEILAVLLAGATPGQRWPGPAECADLLWSGVCMRLGPGRVSPPRAVTAAARLMRAGAATEIAGLVVALATASAVQSAMLRQHPGVVSVPWRDVLLFIEIGVPVPTILWLWLAWANGRGHRWARAMFAGFFGLYTFTVVGKLAAGAASYAPIDLLVVGIQWAIGLAAVLLIFSPSAGAFYRCESRTAAAAHGG